SLPLLLQIAPLPCLIPCHRSCRRSITHKNLTCGLSASLFMTRLNTFCSLSRYCSTCKSSFLMTFAISPGELAAMYSFIITTTAYMTRTPAVDEKLMSAWSLGMDKTQEEEVEEVVKNLLKITGRT